ncbi:hypothetical protein H0H92_013707 [Tricholoma furcatifolium]|nr:hypothetical protein H0H92_013707 [Tricholoma furcatifolium]
MSTGTESNPNAPITVGIKQTKDFCNAFWGPGNRGSKILSGRMAVAQATIKELLQFINERSHIEANYAARLATLSNSSTLGRNETGELRDSLEALRRETEKQAVHHNLLSESTYSRSLMHLRPLYAQYTDLRLGLQDKVERKLKEKEAIEEEVVIARVEYDTDCALVFSLIEGTYAAQSTEEQEQLIVELGRARDIARASQMKLAQCTEHLRNLLLEWEELWKTYCDACQGLEEERLERFKELLWDNANEFSTTAVKDDLAWECIRVSLEKVTEEDLEAFVSICGTGSDMPDAPTFTSRDLDRDNLNVER